MLHPFALSHSPLVPWLLAGGVALTAALKGVMFSVAEVARPRVRT